MRPESNISRMPLRYLGALSKQLRLFCIKRYSATFAFLETATGGAL